MGNGQNNFGTWAESNGSPVGKMGTVCTLTILIAEK
jgi:hypothetical protein